MMQRIQANSNEMAKNASSVDVVSKAIQEAVTSNSPNLRYLVVKDVETWAANKKTMRDAEFHDMMQSLTS